MIILNYSTNPISLNIKKKIIFSCSTNSYDFYYDNCGNFDHDDVECHDDNDVVVDCHDDESSDDDDDDAEDIVATLFKFGRKLTLLGSTTQVCY